VLGAKPTKAPPHGDGTVWQNFSLLFNAIESEKYLGYIVGITPPDGRRRYLLDSEVIYLYMGSLSFLNPGSSSQKLLDMS